MLQHYYIDLKPHSTPNDDAPMNKRSFGTVSIAHTAASDEKTDLLNDDTPCSTICDPYLNLFRGIIPAIGGIDLSPILAFVVLDVSDALAVMILSDA